MSIISNYSSIILKLLSMEKNFFGIKVLVVVREGLQGEMADAYISDDPSITGDNVVQIKLPSNSLSIFENIFRKTLDALRYFDRKGRYQTLAIGKLTKDTGNLNNYQVVRAMLCGIFGFCQLAGKSGSNIKQITLVVPPAALSAVVELDRTENFKYFCDTYGERPDMPRILQREYGYR